jgi:hypothetical protein
MQVDIQTAAFRRHRGPICASLSLSPSVFCQKQVRAMQTHLLYDKGNISSRDVATSQTGLTPQIQFAVVRFPHLGAQQKTAPTVLFSVPFIDITSKSDMAKLATCESMV